MTISSDIAEQTEQCLKNIASALQKYFGDVRPAAMMISARLLDARMLIEVDVTAIRQFQLRPRPWANRCGNGANTSAPLGLL